MNSKVLIAAGLAGYAWYNQNKTVQKSIEQLKSELANTSSYTQAQLDEINRTNDLNNFVEPKTFNLKLRSIIDDAWNYELLLTVKNTNTASVKLQDFAVLIECEDGQSVTFNLSSQVTIQADETKQITIGGGKATIFTDKTTRKRITSAYAAFADKKLLSSCSSSKKVVGKSLSATATVSYNFGGSTTNFNSEGKIWEIGGTVTYMGATGTYNKVGSIYSGK